MEGGRLEGGEGASLLPPPAVAIVEVVGVAVVEVGAMHPMLASPLTPLPLKM